MIPKDFITEWRASAPWVADRQVEQDLVISRALVELFSRRTIANALAFRGGTALYKLHFRPAARYSEDMSQDGGQVTRAMFEQNLAAKRADALFTADMTPLLASGQTWSFNAAYDRVWRELIARLPGDPWKGA